MSILYFLNRKSSVFERAFASVRSELLRILSSSRVLVVGGAGSIGSSVVEILFSMVPRALHVVDVNENALADLVREVRSSVGYVDTDFRTICFDPLHPGADNLVKRNGPYDIILNFAAVKHVRSEKDPFTLSRMFAVNMQLMRRLATWAEIAQAETLFSVSTDKAANPANLMGASKRMMEMVGFTYGDGKFSSARFANVAFSNGSLLKAFWDRLDREQPLSAPSNIKRFFITHEEAAHLCLLEALAGPKGTIAIPRAPGEIELTSFVDVATNVLASRGYEPLICDSEEQARRTKPGNGKWPCYFFESDTSGEKPFEEFIAQGEELVDSPFEEISLIGKLIMPDHKALESVLNIDPITMPKEEVVNRVADVVPEFHHIETGKNLDQRM
ncbi:MAG: polysaccharide biosynthesis protein [Spirochaeta sp.]|jgi:FlaA1/EpsC-like NDP-sugar epimerase|nr:polysaccharide biosynthesis protein [Spirochaeta sp.]